MSGDQVFTSRLKGRPLLDSEGLTIGRIRDVVILPGRREGAAARAGAGRDVAAAPHLRQPRPDRGDLRRRRAPARRHRRPGPLHPADRGDPGSELYGRHATDGTVVDVAISPDRAAADRLGGLRAGRLAGPEPAAPRPGRSCPGTSTRSCSRPARWPSSWRACARCSRPTWPPPSRACRPAAAARSRRPWTTRNWPTCWRRCPSRTRSGCWPASGSSAAPTWWRRCSPTTPRTCSPRCRPSSANGC